MMIWLDVDVTLPGVGLPEGPHDVPEQLAGRLIRMGVATEQAATIDEGVDGGEAKQRKQKGGRKARGRRDQRGTAGSAETREQVSNEES